MFENDLNDFFGFKSKESEMYDEYTDEMDEEYFSEQAMVDYEIAELMGDATSMYYKTIQDLDNTTELLDVVEELAEGKPLNKDHERYNTPVMNIINGIMVAENEETFATESFFGEIDMPRMEEAKKGIFARAADAIMRALGAIRETMTNLFTRLFSKKARYEAKLKKLNEKLSKVSDIDAEKLGKKTIKAKPQSEMVGILNGSDKLIDKTLSDNITKALTIINEEEAKKVVEAQKPESFFKRVFKGNDIAQSIKASEKKTLKDLGFDSTAKIKETLASAGKCMAAINGLQDIQKSTATAIDKARTKAKEMKTADKESAKKIMVGVKTAQKISSFNNVIIGRSTAGLYAMMGQAFAAASAFMSCTKGAKNDKNGNEGGDESPKSITD